MYIVYMNHYCLQKYLSIYLSMITFDCLMTARRMRMLPTRPMRMVKEKMMIGMIVS